MKKGIKAIIITTSILLIILTTALIYYFGATYKEFDKISRKEFLIPGLDTTFVPQGLTFDEANNKFLVSGYMSDNSPSRIYIVDKQTQKAEKFITLTHNSTPYTEHAGGLAVTSTHIYVVGDGNSNRILKSSLYSAENGKAVEIKDRFKTGNGADFVLINNNNLIVGEFYKEKKYDTPTSHHFKTASGETNKALTFVFSINEEKPNGVEDQTPHSVLSLPNQVQGMSFSKDGNVVLSTSYSIPSSKILVYDKTKISEPTQINLNGKSVQYFELNNNNKIKEIKAPAMSENLVTVDNRVFVLFESNCKKYRFVNRTRLSNVFSMEI